MLHYVSLPLIYDKLLSMPIIYEKSMFEVFVCSCYTVHNRDLRIINIVEQTKRVAGMLDVMHSNPAIFFQFFHFLKIGK